VAIYVTRHTYKDQIFIFILSHLVVFVFNNFPLIIFNSSQRIFKQSPFEIVYCPKILFEVLYILNSNLAWREKMIRKIKMRKPIRLEPRTPTGRTTPPLPLNHLHVCWCLLVIFFLSVENESLSNFDIQILNYSNKFEWRNHQNRSCRSRWVLKFFSLRLFHLKSLVYQNFVWNSDNLINFLFVQTNSCEKITETKVVELVWENDWTHLISFMVIKLCLNFNYIEIQK